MAALKETTTCVLWEFGEEVFQRRMGLIQTRKKPLSGSKNNVGAAKGQEVQPSGGL